VPRLAPRRARRIAFFTWAVLLSVVFGIGFFGLTVLVIGWFGESFGVATPVSELSHGALAGVIITVGFLIQLRAPERRIAGLQQSVLGILAFAITALIGGREEPLTQSLIFLLAAAILLTLHPARREFFEPGTRPSLVLAALSAVAAVPAIGYAASMLAQARDFVGPPHHADRLAEMAATAVAIVLVGLLAAARTQGWRIPAWSAAVAAIVIGVASIVFPDAPGAVGQVWGALVVAWGLVFGGAAEWQARWADAQIDGAA